MTCDKGEYALMWANGMTFAQVFDLMKVDVEAEIDAGLCDCEEKS